MLRMLRDVFASEHRFAEFLPDAEGVVERRHSPLAGLLILTVGSVFAGLLAWSALAEVEQVVRARGQVKPAGQVKVINHPNGGRLAEIHVVEGQRVRAGEPLVSFDPELVRTRLAELIGRWQLKRFEVARLKAELAGGEMVVDRQLAETRPDLLREQKALLASRRQTLASKTQALAQLVERRASEVESIAAELSRLRNSHALLKRQIEAIRSLAEKGLYPRLRLVEVERQLNDLTGDIRKTAAREEAAEAALAEVQSRHRGLKREWRSKVLAELATASAELEQLAAARQRQAATLRQLVVRAPVDGIVQDLMVTAAGQSVGSNQPIMKLVPTDGGVVIEAWVANRDIGSIRLGQPARIKVLAYDYLRYGTLSGHITRIAADATLDPGSGAPGYEITIRTDKVDLDDGQERVSVVPGMTVDVDLLVGERTVLSYLTDRIFRLRDEALREG